MIQEHPERRARTVALVGLIFQVLLVAFYVLLTSLSGSEAMRALTLLASAGILIWLTLLLVYHQRVLVQEEAFENEQLKRERETGRQTIFEGEDEELFLSRRRLRWMYRWLLPIANLVIVGLLTTTALLWWNWKIGAGVDTEAWPAVRHSNVLMWFLGGSAFLSFLLSRYAVGMARYAEWHILRAGASYLMGVTLGSVALAVVLGLIHFLEKPVPEHVLAQVLRVLMLLLSAEFLLNLVLDFYRPRAPDEVPRPAFDSRLLGLFTEPGGIARSIAEAINYQFGFEVSSTWFYKLLERSAVPLAGFAVLSLVLSSSLLFVQADEVAIVERFGQKRAEHGPGLHVKLPWPIDRAYMVPVHRVLEFQIGDAAQTAQSEDDELILWTNEHEQEPHVKVLVATPRLAEYLGGVASVPADAEATFQAGPQIKDQALAASSEAVSVSILRVALTIHYQIEEGKAYDWLTRYANPQSLLKAIAQREVIRFFSNVDVAGVLGADRGRVEEDLRRTIRAAVADAGLPVKLHFIGLQGVHPPRSAADAFQKVIGAEQKRTAAVRSAKAEYNKRLSQVAGSVERAEQLAEAIGVMNRLEADLNVPKADRESARQRVQTLFVGDAERGILQVGGEARSEIARARTQRWRLENDAHAAAIRFEQERATYQAAPRVYQTRRYLHALRDSVKGIRKYVIATAGDHAVQTFHLDVKDSMSAAMNIALEDNK